MNEYETRIELRRNGGKPLYIQIRDYFKSKILDGTLRDGDRIASEGSIQNTFKVSRITARQAIAFLEREGLVTRGRGKGTFVTYKKEDDEVLNGVAAGFTQEVLKKGLTPGTSRFDIIKILPDESMMEVFDINDSEPVYCFRRIRTIDDVRICYMLNYFPPDISIPLDVESYDESVFAKLIELPSIQPTQCLEEFCAMLPSSEICKQLHCQIDTPILCKKRRTFDEAGKVIEYSITYYRGDLYTHSIALKPYSDE